MQVRTLPKRPVAGPRVDPNKVKPLQTPAKPGGRELVRKPEPNKPGLDSPDPNKKTKDAYTSTFRHNEEVNDMINLIMQKRDCGKSEALKHAIRLVGHAMQYEDSVLHLTDDNGTSVLPIMRGGSAC